MFATKLTTRTKNIVFTFVNSLQDVIVPNVESLLDYVFTDEDFSDTPSEKEYKKLCRVMKVMINFYARGERNKKAQYEYVQSELKTIERDLGMIKAQKQALSQFPPHHPKRGEYESQLDNEFREIDAVRAKYATQAKGYEDLHTWGQGIVETTQWLEGNLKLYANQELGMEFDLEPFTITAEDYKKYKRGLEEITYNLQESQDFFEASLDGRLRTFHTLEKCMIETQLEVLRTYPEDSERRKHVESELKKDLEFIEGNLVENPKHRERMQRMHKDFFSILKWQRKRMQELLEQESEQILGDIPQLKNDLAEEKKAAEEAAFKSKFGDASDPHSNMSSSQMAQGCPVPHVAAMINAKKMEEVESKKNAGLIHKIYDA